MRPIKFRAWDKEKKEWVDDFILDSLGNEYQYNKCEFWGDDRNLEIMQFTGLHDKNGKEIYEGDILRHVRGDLTEVKYEADQEHFEFCGFVVEGDEVIGNIHENPELLK